jgi:hypothetical protein
LGNLKERNRVEDKGAGGLDDIKMDLKEMGLQDVDWIYQTRGGLL